MTTLAINKHERVQKITFLTILLLCIMTIMSFFNSTLPSHMQSAVIQTAEARSEGDIWRDFFRNEFKKLISNEFSGVRQLRDTRYDILSHNMWERNKWETDARRMQVQGALAYDGQYIGYSSPRIAELAQQIQEQIISERQANGITNGISYHKIRFAYNSDEQLIRNLCATPGCPYRIQNKILGSKTFNIVFDPSLLS